MEENRPMLTQAEIAAHGAKLHALLNAGLTKEWAILERAPVLAALFELCDRGGDGDIRNLTLEGTVNRYVGFALQKEMPRYVALHDKLVESKFNTKDNRFEFGNDAYAYALLDAEHVIPPDNAINWKAIFGEDYVSPPTIIKVKAFVVNTQSRDFLVVLNNNYDRWSVHFRRIFPSLQDELEAGYIGDMDKYRDSNNLTLLDAVKIAKSASKFADDFPDVSYPSRLSLETFLQGNLIAGDEKAGLGLRYADFRDVGYLASYRIHNGELPDVEGIMTTYHETAYLTCNLSSLFYQLVEEPNSD